MNEWIVLPGRDIQSIYSKPWAFLKKLFWPFKKIFSFNYGFKKNTHTWNLTVFTIVKCYIVGRQISRTLTSCNRGGNGIPLQYSCLENPMDGGAWWPAVHGVAKSRAWLSDFTFTFHFSLSCIGEGNSSPLQCSCLENPRDGGAWWAAVYGVTQSRTRLKPSSSSAAAPLTKLKLCTPKGALTHGPYRGTFLENLLRFSWGVWQSLIMCSPSPFPFLGLQLDRVGWRMLF